MPEYLSPGVYIEEFEIGARPIEGISTSTAGFLGETERGPTTPRLITSWLQYQRVFGSYFGNDKYLPGAVDGFFKNGGARCYIARIVKSGDGGARSSKLMLRSIDDIYIEKSEKDPQKVDREHNKVKEFKDKVLTVNAVGEGTWGNRIAVIVSTGTFSGIKLQVFYWKTSPPSEDALKDLTTALKKRPPTSFEIFDNISISETSSDNYNKVVNRISNLITILIEDETEESTKNAKDLSDEDFSDFYLDDGVDSAGKIASLMLKSIDKDPISATGFENKILKLEATREGKWANSLNVKLSKKEDNVIKLDISSPQLVGTLKILSTEQQKGLKDILNIEIDTNSSGNAQSATTGLMPLGGGTTGNKAFLEIMSIDKALKADDFKDKVLKIEAASEGDWGNYLSVQLSKIKDNKIKLEVFRSEFEISSTNKPLSLQDLNVSVEAVETEPIENIKNAVDASNSSNPLTDGKDPDDPETSKLIVDDYLRNGDEDNKPGKRKGLTAFKEIEDISIVYTPNAYDVPGLVDELITHCENLRYRFAILDAKPSRSDVSSSDLDPRNANPTEYAAFYYPWIKVINPETGLLKLMPPGGYIAGIFARSDIERGVHKAPANEVVRGASDLEFQIMKGEQDILNPRGVNVIRAFPGRGILVWGARTLSFNTLWKYINVRRLFIYIEASIERGTQWVVFDPNNESLWARVIATITQFLTGVWRSGALMGTTPEEAFFVKCDRSTMTQDDIDNGRLICIIGIAPVKPAEFVIFRIAQWQGGSAATE